MLQADRVSISSNASTKTSMTQKDSDSSDWRYRNGKLICVQDDFGEDEERIFLYQGLLGLFIKSLNHSVPNVY